MASAHRPQTPTDIAMMLVKQKAKRLKEEAAAREAAEKEASEKKAAEAKKAAEEKAEAERKAAEAAPPTSTCCRGRLCPSKSAAAQHSGLG